MLIQIKRSPNNVAPASLAPGELAWVEGSKTIFLGLIGGGMVAIAGDGAGYLKENQQVTLSGDASGSGKTAINVALANVVTAGTGTKVTYDSKGRVTASAALGVSDVPDLPTSKITNLQATLDSKATLTNGKIAPEALPALATTETFVVASQAAMLALAAQRGDMAVRTDGAGSFILQGETPGTLSNWVRLNPPDAAASGVQTVNGIAGPNVTLGASNVPFAPTGNIAATNLQAALAELDSEKLSGNQPITVSGDATGTGTTAIALTLASIVTAGTAPKVTFNSKGLITGSSALVAADIPAIAITQVTGLRAELDSKMNSTATIDGGTF